MHEGVELSGLANAHCTRPLSRHRSRVRCLPLLHRPGAFLFHRVRKMEAVCAQPREYPLLAARITCSACRRAFFSIACLPTSSRTPRVLMVTRHRPSQGQFESHQRSFPDWIGRILSDAQIFPRIPLDSQCPSPSPPRILARDQHLRSIRL